VQQHYESSDDLSAKRARLESDTLPLGCESKVGIHGHSPPSQRLPFVQRDGVQFGAQGSTLLQKTAGLREITFVGFGCVALAVGRIGETPDTRTPKSDITCASRICLLASGFIHNQLTNHATNPPINQPTDQLTNHATNQPTNQPTNQLTNHATNQPTDQPTNPPTN